MKIHAGPSNPFQIKKLAPAKPLSQTTLAQNPFATKSYLLPKTPPVNLFNGGAGSLLSSLA